MASRIEIFSRTRLRSLAAVMLLSGIAGTGLVGLAWADGGDQGYRYNQEYAQSIDHNNGSWTNAWRGREAAQPQYQSQPYYRQIDDDNRQTYYRRQDDNRRQPTYGRRSNDDQRDDD